MGVQLTAEITLELRTLLVRAIDDVCQPSVEAQVRCHCGAQILRQYYITHHQPPPPPIVTTIRPPNSTAR